MAKEDICKNCKGDGIIEIKETEKISIDVGTPDEHVLKFTGKGNELPDAIAGDLMVKIHIK
jgi:DnaJ-class molecular chaperone